MEPRHWTALEIIGATTAGKLEGTSRGVNTDPLPFPRPVLPSLPLFPTRVSPIPIRTPLSFST